MKKLISLGVCLLGITTVAYSANAKPSLEYAQSPISFSSDGRIGVELENQNGVFIIKSVIPNSPAEKGLLKAGDVIEAVQTSPDTTPVSTKGKTMDEVVDLIRGSAGVPVILIVIRGQTELIFSVTREQPQG